MFEIGTVEAMHECAEIGLGGLDDQMLVICHENKGVKDSTILLDGLLQIREGFFVIPRRQENLSPLISSCGNMIECAFEGDTQGSCHPQLQRRIYVPNYLAACPVSRADPCFVIGYSFSFFWKKAASMSTGSGTMIVEFFSVETSDKV